MGSIKFNIPDDKLKHLEVGVVIVVIGIVIMVFGQGDDTWKYHIIIPIVLYAVAVGREIYNKVIQKTKFDWMDIFATTGIAMFIYFLFLLGLISFNQI